jgi:hypothetical protein
LESVAVTPKLNVPVVVGEPEMVPLLIESVRPAGSCPEDIANV